MFSPRGSSPARPTLVLSHNKILAAQLFQEFRSCEAWLRDGIDTAMASFNR